MARSYAKAYYDVWDDKRLSNSDVLVYTGLVRHSYGDSLTVRNIGVRELASHCRVSVDTFNRCIKHLVETGWLDVTSGGKYGDSKVTSIYRLLSSDTAEESVPTVVTHTESHKTIKRRNSDYSQERVEFYKRVKNIADALDIADAWRDEILAWVNRCLDQKEDEILSDWTPKELWKAGVDKFRDSDLRYQM